MVIRTDETLAEMSGSSRDTVRKVEAIITNADPAIIEAARADKLSINMAAQVAELPKEEQAIIAAAPPEEIKQVAKEAVRAHVANNSGNNEWYTPKEYIEAARAVMGWIDTDPASSEIANTVVQATQIFTEADDGRDKTWNGRVWMNPPYAQPLIADFAEAVSSKIETGEIDQACILVNNATETRWFQRMLSVCSSVCFPSGRVRFVDPNGALSAPLQGQAVIYMGDRVDEFMEAFGELGIVLK